MAGRLLLHALAAALVAWGCSPRRATATAPTPAPPASGSSIDATPAPSADAGASAQLPRSPEMERRIAEMERLGDPAITFRGVTQTPPPRGYAVPARGVFPTRGVARVVLYTFGWVGGGC